MPIRLLRALAALVLVAGLVVIATTFALGYIAGVAADEDVVAGPWWMAALAGASGLLTGALLVTVGAVQLGVLSTARRT
ncbi:hypothetical protein [Cellulomonas oligotrophica]|uniref:Uncharacterized protein n=1 Tax=Cellulomonas oligotrophica TaxID=931536 RepID=A0A7Y9FGP9_9CELL|nr:hypothetical protein [Cellulomonas oligotrophica]NYD86895.1 hypothetical protein [Cellulomonas oligotrophica]